MKKLKLLFLFVIVHVGNIVIAQNNTWYVFPPNVPEAANRYIYTDTNNTKWIGGYFNGLHKLSNGSWTDYSTSNSGISDNDVRQSAFDTSGNLWVTSWKNLNKFNVATNSWTSFNVTGQSLDILYSVEVDHQNRIWVGTDGGSNSWEGLYMFNGINWNFYNPTNSTLTGRWITRLKKDLNGKIWGCHYEGLFEINDTIITNHLLQSAGFAANLSTNGVDFDSYNNKWVAVYNGGIAKFDGSNWTIYNTSNSGLPDNKIWSIAVDHNNVVWIGTETQGLVRFDGTTWTSYNTSNSVITNNRIDALSVDQLNNLWITPNYGGLIVHNDGGVSGISGMVYYDANSNNLFDSNEQKLPNQIVNVTSTVYNSITNSAGDYHCAVLNTGSYSAKLIQNSPYINNVSPDSIVFSISSNSSVLQNQNFGLQLQSNINDISIDLTAMSAPRPGFPYTCNLTVSNVGSLPSTNILATFTYDNNLNFDSTSFPFLSHIGDSIVWAIDSLNLFENKSIRVYFTVPANVGLLGSSLQNFGHVADQNIDIDTNNNSYTLQDIVIGAYDPNDKHGVPQGDGTLGEIPSSTPEIIYTIRFQNTGTAEAVNVLLKDTISGNLDLTSIRMISSSHPYSAQINNGGVVWWSFNNINLPDSNSNEPGSHGYIKYAIKLKDNLNNGEQIKNTAHIYFDFNPAIVTNQSLHTINDLITSKGINMEGNRVNYTLYPNPANEALNIATVLQNGHHYALNIFDVCGKQVYTNPSIGQNNYKLNMNQLVDGIYYLQFKSNDKIEYQKVVKQK
jgi:hypothetical protein